MRLLILGALGPYPERIQTFVEDGHELWYACTEILPPAEQLANITAFPLRDSGATPDEAIGRLADLIERERIDVVYSLLNVWDGSNAATAALLRRGSPAPVVRHYKEHYLSPSDDERTCLEGSAGAIFINAESREYFAGVYRLPNRTECLDGDPIPRRYLAGAVRPKLSARDGRPHLLIAGTATDDGGRYDYRELIHELTESGAHVHLYGQFRRLHPTGQMRNTAEVESSYRAAASPERLHIHAPVPPARFVEEWSPYDAGLLHVPKSDDPFRRLNMPNRYSAYVIAGVPVAVPAGEMTAMRRYLETLGAAVLYDDPADLVERLPDRSASAGALAAREQVTFEVIYPNLIAFIRSCL